MNKRIGSLMVAIALFAVCAIQAEASTSLLTASQTTANVGVNDQTAATVPTQANVVETKASSIYAVASLPASSTTITIGNCVVTFTTIASSTTDVTNCSGNAASIDRTLSTSDTLRTAAQIAAVIQSITNATSTLHGALSISATTSTTTTFSTAGTEASATGIEYGNTTSGAILSTASTTGVIGMRQINTVTVGGTVDTGDVFTLTLPSGTITYTTQSTDTTTANIASALSALVTASSSYSTQAFTVAASSNTLVFTAKAAGTGFTQTSSVANGSSHVAQAVTFTPYDVAANQIFTVTINGASYSYTSNSNSVQQVVEGLSAALASDTAVSCGENNVAVTCTAKVAGTPFTYGASVAAASGNSGSSSHRSSSRGGGSSSNSSSNSSSSVEPASTGSVQVSAPAAEATITTTTTLVAAAPTFTSKLMLGSKGHSVIALQTKLTAEGFYKGPVTGYFGAMTSAAVKAYQAAHNVPALGIVGPLTRALLNK